MTGQTSAEQLTRGLRLLGEDPLAHPCGVYLDYLDLLDQWNQSYNLTAIRTRQRMITYHILDSLSVLPFIHGDKCLDAGSGAGLPGLILALARPSQHWLLADSNGKKTRFLNQVVLELKLDNVQVEQVRIEDYQPEQAFSTVTSRALTSLYKFHRQASHLVGDDGILLAMKGVRQSQEQDELVTRGITHELHDLHVPGMDAHRHVVVMGR